MVLLSDLLEIQQTFKSNLGLRSNLDIICPNLLRLFRAHRIVIFKKATDINSKSSYMQFYNEWSLEEKQKRYTNSSISKKLSIDHIYTEYSEMITSGKPILIDKNHKREGSSEAEDFFKDSGILSYMIAPIMGAHDSWGTISVHDLKSDQRDFANDGSSELLEFVAHEISSFIKMNELNSTISENAISDHSRKMFSLGKLAASIAHEINNPIFIIGGFASRLQSIVNEGSFDQKKKEVEVGVNLIQQNCMKITNIVEGLRLMSRRPDREELEVVNINEIISRVVDVCKEHFQLNSIIIETDLCRDELLIECKPGQISQVFTNLLNNSFDALNVAKNLDKKSITIVSRFLDGNAHISVSDSGKRLPPEMIEKIMEPFFSTKSSSKGSGLGLSICKEIVDRIDGSLSVDERCENVKFDIILPLIIIEEDE